MPSLRRLRDRGKLDQRKMLRLGHAQARGEGRQAVVRAKDRDFVVEAHRFGLQRRAFVLRVGNRIRQSGEFRGEHHVGHQKRQYDRQYARNLQQVLVSRFGFFVDAPMRCGPRGARVRNAVFAFDLAGLYQLTGLSSCRAQLGAARANVLRDFVFRGNERAAGEHLEPFVIAEGMLHDAIFE